MNQEDMSEAYLLAKAKVLEEAVAICRQLRAFNEADKLKPLIGMLKGAARIAKGLEEEVTPAGDEGIADGK